MAKRSEVVQVGVDFKSYRGNEGVGQAMFECQICGLLSLGGSACPACGSQLRTDLASSMDSDEVLPSDVPGLDDAAAAWYDLEGIEPPPSDEGGEDAPSPENESSSLPFGYQGESKVYTSRLPFGIGSFAEGIPFEAAEGASQGDAPVAEPPTKPVTAPPPSPPPAPTPAPSIPEPTPTTIPEPAPVEQEVESTLHESPAPPEPPELPEPVQMVVEARDSDVIQVSPVVTAKPAPAPSPAPAPERAVHAGPVRLQSARLIEPSAVNGPSTAQPEVLPVVSHATADVPEYWRIDAPIPNYEEIYDQHDEVVEVQFSSLEDDVVVFDHTTDSPAAVFHSPLEATPVARTTPSISLDLHPVQALNVDVGGSPELSAQLSEGFAFMQQGAWSQAARTFQRMAASLPTSPEVFNNYGISLLQRAVGMRDGPDIQQQGLADAQFESAILALREAAKGAPANGDILVNLASALIESGRSEKALGIMNVHNARTPNSAKGINTAAVAMFNLGQLTQATNTLQNARDDPVALQNLQKLSPA
ncbi:MAG: tetratricopeptide repeat protein [Candidatus Poseidonia sp.]|nr:tetratricopeptide repeat protein [Poseidonia sp.]